LYKPDAVPFAEQQCHVVKSATVFIVAATTVLRFRPLELPSCKRRHYLCHSCLPTTSRAVWLPTGAFALYPWWQLSFVQMYDGGLW